MSFELANATVASFCLRGHNIIAVGGRYSNGECKECARARVRTWKHNHRDLVLAGDKARREAYRQVFGVTYVPNKQGRTTDMLVVAFEPTDFKLIQDMYLRLVEAHRLLITAYDQGENARQPEASGEDVERVREIVDKFPVQEEFDAKQCLVEELAADRAAARRAGAERASAAIARHHVAIRELDLPRLGLLLERAVQLEWERVT